MKAYIKENIINPIPLCNISLKGYVAELMNIFFEKRIFSDHAKNVVFKEAEDAFRNCVDDEGVVGLWQGEFWGKWIISAARVCKYTKDNELKKFLHNAALTLIGFQRKNGYLGTYKNSKNFMTPDAKEAEKEMGFECDWNWNIWCRKYTLWGLLECYELTGDKKIINACTKMADNLMSELKEEGKRLGDTGTFCGMPSCSILKPMLILYRITENEKYLSFCLDFSTDWENADLMPGLIANTLNKKRIGNWYEGPKWAKAYEMMSCFDGLIELYRITGEEKYLTSCKNFYELANQTELNSLYNVGYNDEFLNAKFNINAITEPCDIIHWMRICHELFALTGDVKYLDSFELAFYNPFLASSFKDGLWGARGARSHGRHLYAITQAKLKNNHCCVNNMPRGYMNMVETCVMTSKDTIYINFYSDFSAVLENGIKITVEGDYLADSFAKINVGFSDNAPCEINLRIPSWSEKNKVTVDGCSYNPGSGYFKVLPKNKTTDIEVQFDNDIKIIEMDSYKDIPDTEIQNGRWTSLGSVSECSEDMLIDDNRCILQKGALLLCRTKLIGNTQEEMFGSHLIDKSYKCTYTRVNPIDGINVQFDITLENDSDKITTKVCDYASGTNMKSDDMYMFSIYF